MSLNTHACHTLDMFMGMKFEVGSATMCTLKIAVISGICGLPLVLFIF